MRDGEERRAPVIDWTRAATYVLTLACCTYLTATGKLPSEVLAAFLGVGIPAPWLGRKGE